MSFENIEIENILKEFVALIVKQKNLIFSVSDIEVSELLLAEKIVKEENGYIKILNYEKYLSIF